MPLTITALQRRYLERQDQRWVILVDIDTNASTDLDFASGTSSPTDGASGLGLDRIQSVKSVTALSISLDPIERTTQRTRMTVKLKDDRAIRNLLLVEPLKNSLVTIKFAPAESVTSSLPYWKGLIEDIIFEPGLVVLRCKDPLLLPEKLKYRRWFANMHPLEVIEDVLTFAGRGSLVDAATIGTWDHDTDISHIVAGHISGWVEYGAEGSGFFPPNDLPPGNVSPVGVAVGGVAAMSHPPPDGGAQNKGGTKAGDLIDQMALMINSLVWTDETGAIKSKYYDPTVAVDDTWTADDLIGDIEILQIFGDQINEVLITQGVEPWTSIHVGRDTTSQADYAAPSESDAIIQHELTMPYSGAPLIIVASGTGSGSIDATQTSFGIASGGLAGMCGARVDDSNARGQSPGWDATVEGPLTQDADAKASSGRPLYLQLGDEIIQVTAMTIDDDFPVELVESDGYGEALATVQEVPIHATVDTAVRGYGATSGAAHTSTTGYYGSEPPVKDVTASILVAGALLTRCANGMPKIKVKTTLAKYEYQIGDFITIDSDPLFAWYNVDGLNSTNVIKWEIVGKEVDITEATPVITWTLAFSAIATPGSTAILQIDSILSTYQSATEVPVGGTMYLGSNQTATKSVAMTVANDSSEESADQILGFDSATGIYHVPVTGHWDIYGGVYVTGIDASVQVFLEIHVNGTRVAVAGGYSSSVGDIYLQVQKINTVLQVNNQVELVFDNTASATNGTIVADVDHTFLTVRRIIT